MCWDCFKKYTDNPVVNERVQSAFDMIHAAGDDAHYGFLHIIVDDWNVDDWFFDLDDDENWFSETYPKAEQWERDIFDTLAKLTEAERATAIAMDHGYIERDGTIRPGLT